MNKTKGWSAASPNYQVGWCRVVPGLQTSTRYQLQTFVYKLKLQFNIDEILHHNNWVNPNEKVVENTWIPNACLQDNEITIKIKRLSGTIAVLSGIEIESEEVGGSGGPQGKDVKHLNTLPLLSIYQNPAKGIIKIQFNSPDERMIMIKLYDVSGRLVDEQNISKSKIGRNEVLIRPKGCGIYFVFFETEDYKKIEKVVLLK